MKKLFISFTFFFTFLLGINSAAFGEIANGPSRGPSVLPLVEIDIEEQNKTKSAGYDFNQKVSEGPLQDKARVPANIVTKPSSSSPYSFLGPLIFLIALPIGLWIMVSKRFKSDPEHKKAGYYTKTHQFGQFQSELAKSDDDHDDIDYPKAS